MQKYRAPLTTIDPIFIDAATGMDAYRLLPLGYADVPAMAALQTRCGPDNVVPRDADYYRQHFANGHSAVGIFDMQGVLVAHSLVRNIDGNSTMLNVLVDPQHRGQRLQSRMVAQWLDEAARAGCQTASARVRVLGNVSLHNFENAGLQRVAEEPSPEAPEHMTYLLQKSLQPTYIPVRIAEHKPTAF